MLKTAVFAPTPRAIANTAKRIGTGVLAKLRNANEKYRMAHVNVLSGHSGLAAHADFPKPYGCLPAMALNRDVTGVGTRSSLMFIAAVLRRDARNSIVVSD